MDTVFLLSEPHTVFDPPPGSLLNGTEEGLYFPSQSLSQFPPGKYRQQNTVKLSSFTIEMHRHTKVQTLMSEDSLTFRNVLFITEEKSTLYLQANT